MSYGQGATPIIGIVTTTHKNNFFRHDSLSSSIKFQVCLLKTCPSASHSARLFYSRWQPIFFVMQIHRTGWRLVRVPINKKLGQSNHTQSKGKIWLTTFSIGPHGAWVLCWAAAAGGVDPERRLRLPSAVSKGLAARWPQEGRRYRSCECVAQSRPCRTARSFIVCTWTRCIFARSQIYAQEENWIGTRPRR